MSETTALRSVLDPNNPEVARYRSQAPELLEVAEAFVIATDHDCDIASDHVRTTSAAVKGIRLLFKPAKQALDQAKKQVTLLETTLLDGFQRADDLFRHKITDYKVQQRRKAEEQRRLLEAEARKQREDEQVAEAARLESMANATGDDHFRAAAERVLNAAPRPAIVSIAPAPKTKGVALREETGIDVRDLDKFIAHVAATGQGREGVQANVTWLRKEAEQRGTALQDGDELFPGIVVTKTPDLTVRTR